MTIFFEFCHMNVNSQEMQEVVDEYVKCEACFCKIKVCLTQLHGKNCMMMPWAMELNDVTRNFYEHINLGFRLKKIRREQLAWLWKNWGKDAIIFTVWLATII
jgi:hypothetical protein